LRKSLRQEGFEGVGKMKGNSKSVTEGRAILRAVLRNPPDPIGPQPSHVSVAVAIVVVQRKKLQRKQYVELSHQSHLPTILLLHTRILVERRGKHGKLERMEVPPEYLSRETVSSCAPPL
jgi:hypothetical protein